MCAVGQARIIAMKQAEPTGSTGVAPFHPAARSVTGPSGPRSSCLCLFSHSFARRDICDSPTPAIAEYFI